MSTLPPTSFHEQRYLSDEYPHKNFYHIAAILLRSELVGRPRAYNRHLFPFLNISPNPTPAQHSLMTEEESRCNIITDIAFTLIGGYKRRSWTPKPLPQIAALFSLEW